MLKHMGTLVALAGLALAIWLVLLQDLSTLGSELLKGGPLLVAAALAHVPTMTLNAQAWRILVVATSMPRLWMMLRIVWVRESVNGLLPVARVGGEIVSYRLMRLAGINSADAIASLAVDMALSIVSQAVFAIFGVVLLAHFGNIDWYWQGIVGGLLLLLAGAAAFVLVQRRGLAVALMRLLNRVAADRLVHFAGHSQRIDDQIRCLWERPDLLWRSFSWQLIAWVAGTLEIWLAAWALGHPIPVGEALMIEALIQAISSAAFFVPGALGVQEGGFLLVGASIGLSSEAAISLALARRLRDLIIFVPGLLTWHWSERTANTEATTR